MLRILAAVVFIAAVAYGVFTYVSMVSGKQSTRARQTASTTFYLNGSKVSKPWLSGYSISTGHMGSGAIAHVYDNWSYHSAGDMVSPKLVLQQNIGAGWQTVTTDITFNAQADIMAEAPAYLVPAGKKQVSVRYRLGSLAYTGSMGRVANTSYSAPITVVYENQARYTGLAKTMYGLMSAYCPNTAVHITKHSKEHGDEAGEYVEGQLLINISESIAGYTTVNKRTVALHECAHEREFLNYGGSAVGWQQMEKDTASIFVDDATPAGITPTRGGVRASLTFNPVEHAADCAALSVNPGGYLGYGGYCNPQELAAGRALLAGNKLGAGS